MTQRTHLVQLIDADTGGTISTEVVYLTRVTDPERGRWRTRCSDCDWSNRYLSIGYAVTAAYEHANLDCAGEDHDPLVEALQAQLADLQERIVNDLDLEGADLAAIEDEAARLASRINHEQDMRRIYGTGQ